MMGEIKWRKWNTILHRDIGYLIVALTLAYSISGIAVNHTADWNPNYKVQKHTRMISPVMKDSREEIVADVRSKLQLSSEPQNIFRPDHETLQLFYEDETYSVDLPTGTVLIEQTQSRPVLFEVNQLHLNTPKQLWTYIADLYALSLMVVSVTGLFVLKGKTGITGRGAWLTGIGVAVPVAYWLYYLYL
jgi:hypothetical protein